MFLLSKRRHALGVALWFGGQLQIRDLRQPRFARIVSEPILETCHLWVGVKALQVKWMIVRMVVVSISRAKTVVARFVNQLHGSSVHVFLFAKGKRKIVDRRFDHRFQSLFGFNDLFSQFGQVMNLAKVWMRSRVSSDVDSRNS